MGDAQMQQGIARETGGTPDTAFRLQNGVGSTRSDQFLSSPLTAYLLAVYASHPPGTQQIAALATGRPATALTGLDLHQLDFIKSIR